jgi:3-phosphoshikimate 1-carboxyvinyltransferase
MTVTNLSPHSPQGDREILDILRSFGADISIQGDAVTVFPRPLHGIDRNVRDIPDLVPPIALVAACAEGTTRITGAARLRIKESDRLESVSAAIRALGGKVTVHEDGLTIEGGSLRGGCVDSQNDHRIAMLAAIASAVCPEGVELQGERAVEKSYPNFWNDFNKLVISHV